MQCKENWWHKTQIKAEKEQLIKDGKIKKEKPLPPITQDEIPYDLPHGWEWVRLGNIIKISSGNFLPAEKMNQNGKIPVYGGNGINGYHDEYLIDKPTLIIGRVGFYCGCVHLSKGKAWVTDNAFITQFSENNIDIKFLQWLLIFSDLGKNDNATAQPVVSGKKIYPLVVPLPPLAEQKRIVEKLEEILPLVDEYGKNEEILSEMNQKLPKQIRQSILQYAVQGKLVVQNPQDEPASELLKRIKAEKEQLIKDGKIKKEKPLPPITQDEIPYDLPQGWEWVKLGDLCQINPRNFIPDTTESGFIPMTLIKDGFNNSHSFEIRKWSEIKKEFTHFQNNDIVIAKITPCFQNRKSAIIQNLPNGIGAGTTELHVIRDNTNIINMKYLLLNFKTEYFIQNGIKIFTGTAGQQRIGKEYIANYLIPLPPLAEQKRIVSKVKELMQLVDKLENI